MIMRGDNEKAAKFLEEAIRIQPNNAHVHRLRAYALRLSGHLDEAEKELGLSLTINQEYYRTWCEAGQLRIAQKKWPQACDALKHAIKLRPEDFDSHINLSIAYRMCDERALAYSEAKVANTIRPTDPKPLYMMGELLLEADQPVPGVAALRRAVAFNPNNADAQLHLGMGLMRTGQGEAAAEPLMAAIRLAPGAPGPMFRLAWVLATHPNPKMRSGHDAVALAQRADELSNGKSADALDALAAGLAEIHRYDEAVTAATKAAKLARESDDKELAEQIDKRITIYKAGRAVRDGALAGADLHDTVP
jgi:Flp pilus assembly protein TadD